MLKKCPACNKKREMKSNQKYCNDKCKKTFENTKYSGPKGKLAKGPQTTPEPPLAPPPSTKVARPKNMSLEVAAYWDELAPEVEERGHLNVLSKRILYIYCVLQSKIDDIVTMLDMGTIETCKACGVENTIPSNRSLLQLDDKWSVKEGGTETRAFKESSYSGLLRLYSARSLEYAKQLYLTPASVRGNFGLEDKDDVDPHDAFLEMGGK